MKALWAAILLPVLLATHALAAPKVVGSGESQTRRVTVEAGTADTGDSPAIQNGCAVWRGSFSGTGSMIVYALASESAAASSGTSLATFSSTSASVTSFETSWPWLKVAATAPGSGTDRLFLYCAREAGGGGASDRFVVGTGSIGYMDEAAFDYIVSGGEPLAIGRTGGWRDYYFSSEAGGQFPLGVDTNPCTAAAPCLTKHKIKDLLAPGVRIILDHDDDFSIAAFWTGNNGFRVNQTTLGCPPNRPHELCWQITTTAPDKATTRVPWGNPVGSNDLPCFDVLTDDPGGGAVPVDRGWAFAQGLDITCDSSHAAAGDADAFESSDGGKVWCHNCDARVTAGDASENCITAHDGSVAVLSGIVETDIDAASTGDNKCIATGGGGGKVVVITKGTLTANQAASASPTVFCGCGGSCGDHANDNDPTVILLGPHIAAGAIGATTPLIEMNPDAGATAYFLAAFTSYEHNNAVGGRGLVQHVANNGTDHSVYDGYRTSYMNTIASHYNISGGLVATSSITITDVGALVDGPTGSTGSGGSYLHFADADWVTTSSANVSYYTYDNNNDGGGVENLCYLESATGDVVSSTAAGCQTSVDAKAATRPWNLNAATATQATGEFTSSITGSTLTQGRCSPDKSCARTVAGTWQRDFPGGVILPGFITGTAYKGVKFGNGDESANAGRL